MKQTVNLYDFERAFVDMNRADNFSYAGKQALFEWLEEMDEECGTETELDVIGLCCEFSEYDTALEAAKEYGWEPEQDPEALEYMSNELLTLVMTLEEAESCTHQGPCDEDVKALIETDHIREQLDEMDPDDIRRDLEEMGAWDEEELADDEENLLRFVWIAAGQIVDEYDEEEIEEAALDWLNDQTSVITFDGGVIIAGF